MPQATLRELAEQVGGRVVGNANTVISDALPLQDARPGTLTLCDCVNKLTQANESSAAAVVTDREYSTCVKPLLVVKDLHTAFATIVELLRPNQFRSEQGLHPTAVIADSAELGEDVTVLAGVSIGEGCTLGSRCVIHPGVTIMPNCHLGDDCVLFPGVVLYPDTRLGQRVTIHANTVLGAYGFGYKMVDGSHRRTSQLGWVQVEDDVELGAGVTIDRGTYGPTVVGEGSKIDNQVQIGHNCRVGRHNLICSQVGIAGSCSTGDYVVMAGQAGMADHIHLADRVIVGAQSGIMHSIDSEQTVLGSPAGPVKQTMQQFAAIARLPEMRRELRRLEKQLSQLSKETQGSNHSSERSSSSGPQESDQGARQQNGYQQQDNHPPSEQRNGERANYQNSTASRNNSNAEERAA